MAIYSKESLETLRQRVDLVDVLSSHMELKRQGAVYKGLCPFHDEKTPSFMIQKGDLHYHCFGCGAHGDAIQFLMTHLKMGFSESVEHLAERFHVHLEKMESSQEPKGPPKALLKEALELACQFYHFTLLHTEEGHAALEYLFSRGITLDFVRQFSIGLSPKQPGPFAAVMNAKKMAPEILVGAGLLAHGRDGGTREFFSDRIMFPIRDAASSVIGFSGRKYKEETFGGKYINTPETPLFKKSRVLFGLDLSRKRIAKERQAIIVEGQIDALRLIHMGFNITVAGQGTAFGEGHAKELLNLGVNTVYLALDSDGAGQEAAVKIGNIFQKSGVEAKVVSLPSGHDPDSFLREFGPDAFQRLLEESGDYLEFLVKAHGKRLNIDSPAGKNELVHTIVSQIRQWDQPLMVHESLLRLAHLAKVPESMIGIGLETTPNVYLKKAASAGLHAVDPDRILESDLLRWLILMGSSHPHFIQIVSQNIKVDDFHVPICRSLFETYMDHHDQKIPIDLLGLSSSAQDPEAQVLINEVMQKIINRERAELHLKETVQKLLDRNWMKKREEVKMKLQSGQCSDEEAFRLAKEFDALKRHPTVKV